MQRHAGQRARSRCYMTLCIGKVEDCQRHIGTHIPNGREGGSSRWPFLQTALLTAPQMAPQTALQMAQQTALQLAQQTALQTALLTAQQMAQQTAL